MGMKHRSMYRTLAGALLLVLLCACTPTSSKVVVTPPLPTIAPPVFPPQKAMETGDYAAFAEDNQKALGECRSEAKVEDGRCDVVLFNLGFVYAYPKSPYWNQAKALRYFEELVRKYPQSPWAFQAKAWTDLMKKAAASDNKRRRLKNELKSKDEAISGLQEQIKRSRDIDMEIEQKERQLLK